MRSAFEQVPLESAVEHLDRESKSDFDTCNCFHALKQQIACYLVAIDSVGQKKIVPAVVLLNILDKKYRDKAIF